MISLTNYCHQQIYFASSNKFYCEVQILKGDTTLQILLNNSFGISFHHNFVQGQVECAPQRGDCTRYAVMMLLMQYSRKIYT